MRGNLWDASAPPESDLVAVLIYRSRLIGADQDLVVWGGGNTSTKTVERDFRGREREVLRIKGSGTDLKSIDAGGFPGVFRDDLLPLLARADMSDEEMTAYLEHCMVEPTGRRPSIETLLHAFLPARHVDHVHADAIVTLTNTENGSRTVREALGEGIAFVPYRRPGFQLAKQVYEAAAGNRAVVLEKHGLVTWGDTAEESYRTTIELVQQAESYLAARLPAAGPVRSSEPAANLSHLLLRLRGALGHVILRTERGPAFRALSDRPDVAELAAAGPATPDHVLRIRPWSCVLDGDDPASAIAAYERRYRDFFRRNAEPGLAMLDPHPKVFLAPGAGMVTAGRDAREAQVVAEVGLHTLQVAATGTDVHGSYRSLNEDDLFHVDYWPLELYKLTLAPAPRELEGRIVVVTGAASGIGRAVARKLAGQGAQLVLLDLNAEGLATTAGQIESAGGAAPLCLDLDLCDEQKVHASVAATIEAFGGIDGLVSNAGIPAAGALATLSPDLWRKSIEVNATSHFLLTAEVLRAMEVQGLGGSLVYIASKNAFSPGAGFGAYSAAKAAQLQLARIAALEGGKAGIRANIVNPDAIFEDSGLWTEQVRRERAAAHGVPEAELEQFYARRTLLQTTISGDDVAQAVLFLLSDRARVTTGTVIAVDGGVAGAFPR